MLLGTITEATLQGLAPSDPDYMLPCMFQATDPNHDGDLISQTRHTNTAGDRKPSASAIQKGFDGVFGCPKFACTTAAAPALLHTAAQSVPTCFNQRKGNHHGEVCGCMGHPPSCPSKHGTAVTATTIHVACTYCVSSQTSGRSRRPLMTLPFVRCILKLQQACRAPHLGPLQVHRRVSLSSIAAPFC